MNDNKMNPNARLTFLERFAYGIGDYAGNLVYSAISAFLLVYYTNVVGASAAAAASIIAISKIFDGISDLVMGYIIDHTHSKWGKARPWIARLCIPLAVCTVLMFTVPASFVGKTQLAYMFLTYNLVSTIFYTGINVPYATLNGLMTTNQYERGLLGNFRNLLATAGTMTINTVVLKMTAAFGGGRRDEEKSRAKERIFSFRNENHAWDPKNQRPEMWKLYNSRINKGESIRVFPISNWTETDIWQYIKRENIDIVPLYFADKRPVVERDGMLIMVDDDRFKLREGEKIEYKNVRFRTLGCYPLTGGIESNATTLDEIIDETLSAVSSERTTRVIDNEAAGSMERRKREGYF